MFVKQGFFSISADEATDCAIDEQLAVSVRYVNPHTGSIEERFLAFSECLSGVTGSAIANHILQLLSDWQLPATKLRGHMMELVLWLARTEEQQS